MKIYLIRHGQTTGDVENRYGGAYDDELSDQGLIQARQLAGKLAGSKIQILYCSPLVRAQQTAKILQAELNCEIKTVENLRERNKNGILTGMTKSEAQLNYPELVEKLKDYRNQIPGAESQDAFARRIKQAFRQVTGDTQYSTIGIVTHGMPFWVIFEDLLHDHGIVALADCAYAVLNQKNQQISLEKMEGIEYRK